jgi:hypothetical protein
MMNIHNIRCRALDNMSKAFFDTDLISTRLTLAVAEGLWAIMLFWPGNTFDRPTYQMMSNIMPELYWAFLFLISSVLQFSIVLFSQYTKPWVQVFANWNAVLWVFVVLSSILSVYPPIEASGAGLALALAAVWIWMRPLIVRNAKASSKNVPQGACRASD